MPVPLPHPSETDLVPPSSAEVEATARGVATAVSPPNGLTRLQCILLESVFKAMTGHAIALGDAQPLNAVGLAEVLRHRNLAFRTRIVQIMLLAALVLRPLPESVVDQVGEGARELSVNESLIGVARRFASGSLGLAAVDFERNGYTAEWRAESASELHTSRELATAWDLAVDDPELAQRWSDLGSLPDGTLGRGVFSLYQSRGFIFPGLPGSAPPLLAQHDWVHVLADYGTTVESELEVFAFIARANDDMRAFSLLAMVVSLFETGYLRTGAGLFESNPGHLSEHTEVATRIADAMRRGALCRDSVLGVDSIDFLGLDWFTIADLPINEARRRFGVVEKSPEAVTAGSAGPWEPGGISEYQLNVGRALAEREGRPYEGGGPGVTETETPLITPASSH
jgi:hypothetical protein